MPQDSDHYQYTVQGIQIDLDCFEGGYRATRVKMRGLDVGPLAVTAATVEGPDGILAKMEEAALPVTDKARDWLAGAPCG